LTQKLPSLNMIIIRKALIYFISMTSLVIIYTIKDKFNRKKKLSCFGNITFKNYFFK
jgi:hypothetical protein